MRIAKTAITRINPSSGPSRFSQARAKLEPEIAQVGFVSATMSTVTEPRAVATGSFVIFALAFFIY